MENDIDKVEVDDVYESDNKDCTSQNPATIVTNNVVPGPYVFNPNTGNVELVAE